MVIPWRNQVPARPELTLSQDNEELDYDSEEDDIIDCNEVSTYDRSRILFAYYSHTIHILSTYYPYLSAYYPHTICILSAHFFLIRT